MRSRMFADKLRLIVFALIFAIATISAQTIFASAAGNGQIVLTTQGDGFSASNPAVIQPVISVPGAADGDIVTASAVAPVTLSNNTAVVSGGVARFTELTMTNGASNGANNVITYSDGNTSVTQNAIQYYRAGILTVNNSADSGPGFRWVAGAYLSIHDAQIASVNAASISTQLQSRNVVVPCNGTLTISNAINSTTANTLVIQSAGQIILNSSITTAGGTVKFASDVSGVTSSFDYDFKFNSGSSVSTNGGNIVIGKGSFPEMNPAFGSSVVSMNSATLNSGTGSVSIKTTQGATSSSTNIGAARQIGLYMVGSTVQASGNGSVLVEAKVIANKSAGSTYSVDASGIYLKSGSTISTENGDVTLNNAAHTASSGVYSHVGVRLLGTIGSPSKVTTSGTGSINISGAVGNVHTYDTGAYDSGRVQGVSLGSYSEVSTSSGNISITGTTGNLPGTSPVLTFENAGVRIGDGASTQTVVRAGANGSVTVAGTAGNHAISIGVRVRGAQISTYDGPLSITGTSLDNSTSSQLYSQGVQLTGTSATSNASRITSNNGKISITGTSGTTSQSSSGLASAPGQTEGVRLGHTVVDSSLGQIAVQGTTKGLGSFTLFNGALSYKHIGVALSNEPTQAGDMTPRALATASIGQNATSDVVIRGLIDSTSTTNSGISWTSIAEGAGFGGPSATGNFIFYTSHFGGSSSPEDALPNVDTSGSLILRPVSSDFQSSAPVSPTSTDPMMPLVVPSSRVSLYDIGPTTGTPTRPITIKTRAQMNSSAVLRVRSGNLIISALNTPASIPNIAGEINGTVTFIDGIYDKVAFNLTGATKTVSFQSDDDADGVVPANIGNDIAVWGVPASLAIVGTATGSGNAGISFTSPKVEAKDAYGLSLASFNRYGNAMEDSDDASTSIALSAATAGSSVLSGTTGPKTLVSGSTGVAFAGLSVDLAGTYKFTYSGSFNGQALTPVDSGNFSIGAGAPTMVLEYPEVTYRSSNAAYTATTKTSAGNGTLSFTASPSTVCTISSSTGAITAVSGGTCTVVMTAQAVTGPPAYLSGTKTVSFSVLRAAQTTSVSISTSSVTYGSTVSLASTGGDSTSAFVYRTTTSGCSVTGSTLSTTLGAGNSCTVFGYRAADTKYLDSSEVSGTITITKANQTTVTAPTGTQIGYLASPGLYLSSLTFTGGSGTGSISFSTSTTGCSIASNILSSTNNAGTTCVIAISKAGDSNYNPSSAVNFTVSITKAAQSQLVAPATVFLTYGDSAGLDLTTLSFTGGSGTGLLTFSTTTSGCSISNNVLTSSNNAGMGCTVATTKATDTNYNAGNPVNLSVTIVRAMQAPITITSTSGTYGNPLALAATGGSGGGAFTFNVVSGTCSISGVSLTLGTAGSSCMVTATRGGSQNYEPGTSSSTSITSLQSTQTPLVISSTSGTYGQTLSLSISGGNGSGAVTFVVDSGTCSVSGAILTLGNAGSSCMVTATKAASTNYSAISSLSTSITTVKANQASLSVTSLAVTFGGNLTLTSSGGSSNGSISYTRVSGPCTLSSDVLSTTGAGNCVVTATMAGGTNYNDVSSANTTVVISKANQSSLSWNLSSTSVAYLGNLTLATTGGSGTGTVVYSVSNTSTCSIVGTTLIPSDAGSTCEIMATKVSDSNYNSADTATQTITVTKISQATLSFSNSNALVYGQTMDLLATGGSGGGSITYAVSNAGTTGCSLSANRLSVTGAGTCAVTAVRASSTNYNASSTATLSITVSKASQTVSFSSTIPAEPIAGDTYAVSATASSGLTPTITIASGPCSISNNVVTFTSAGNCVISADSSSTNQFLAATTATQTVAIGQRNQTLTFSSTVRAMTVKTFGDPVFFADATTSEPTLTPVYSRGSATTNTACSVSSIGLVVILAVGNCEIEVNQAGDSAVAAASAIKKTFEVLPDRANAPFITSVSAGHESITAAFTPPNYVGGSAITGYQIAAVAGSTTITNSACTLAGSGNTETCSINGLTNGTSYRIKVAAITAAGVGLYSELSAARVPATNPAAVSAFTAVPDNTSIVLTWQDPVSLGGGTFDSYRVFYKLSSSANYPSTYITIQSQSPTNYTITGLVNGESYDVRIVTVTTANTAALVSNTAEVKETPRTVPEAPATLEVLEVAGQLVITWSTPQSDGGNAITEYRVTINGTTCTLANALDNLCTISVPTNGGTYPIEVMAKNDAGYGSAATATFTKAGVSSSGGSGGGSESSSNGQSSIQVLALSVKSLPNVGGQVVSITGKNLGAVTTILIDGIKAKIISVADGLIKFTAPRNTDGPATLTLKSPTASAEVVDAFTYSMGIAKVKVAWVLGFVQANTTIKAADKTRLRSALLKSTGTVAVTCVGYQSYSYNTAKDAQTAMGRAKQACNYLKSVNPKLTVKSVIARTTLAGTPSRKLAVQFKTSK